MGAAPYRNLFTLLGHSVNAGQISMGALTRVVCWQLSQLRRVNRSKIATCEIKVDTQSGSMKPLSIKPHDAIKAHDPTFVC